MLRKVPVRVMIAQESTRAGTELRNELYTDNSFLSSVPHHSFPRIGRWFYSVTMFDCKYNPDVYENCKYSQDVYEIATNSSNIPDSV